MVQLMGSLHFDKVEDFAEEEYGPLTKRSRCPAPPLNQWSSEGLEFPVPPSQYNPLDEPSPLGLRLRKSPSLLDLIQMRLAQGSSSSAEPDEVNSKNKKDGKGIAACIANDKLKASNFPASLLRIGSWEYVSRYEGDLVAKCYFAKHKLVWEVLDGGLKSKIEIQWSDITGLKAECPDDGPGSLTIVLARQPIFFRETNPQPRKHTLWQATSDFTDGQASINKQHYLQCPPGVLGKHYEKLIQCDLRLGILSQQPEIFMDSPFFESKTAVLEDSEESEGDGCHQPPSSAKAPSPSISEEATDTLQLSSSNLGFNPLATHHVSKEAPSPSSVMDSHAVEGDRKMDVQDSEGNKSWETMKLPGIRPSMSMSDLVNHIENRISEQMSSGSLPLDKASECQEMLENISQVLLSDTHCSTGFNEKSLMKKVNSLCCLLQDPAMASSAQVEAENPFEAGSGKNVTFDLMSDSAPDKAIHMQRKDSIGDLLFSLPNIPSEGNKSGPAFKPTNAMQRKDSLGDMLFNLPSIASLPKFLFGIAEDDETRAT